ncbi:MULTISPECIES: MBL fold metallo-hydrolase [Deferrisoma]
MKTAHLTEPVRIEIPTPYAVGTVNAYLLPGDPPTLVDAGPCTPEAWGALVSGLGRAGLDAADVGRLVLTHPHHDHAGLARRVRDAAGCPVLAHPVDHGRLRDEPGVWEGIVGFLDEVCRRAGVPGDYRRELRESMGRLRTHAEPLDAVDPLDEGMVLETTAGRWEVLHTPGHARGALCLWDPETRTLVSGDTLIPHISSNAVAEPGRGVFRDRTLIRYIATLKRIRELGCERVLPGHGAPMGNPDDLIETRLAFYDRRAASIREATPPEGARPWELVRRLFPDVEPGWVFLAVSEVIGHLDLLADRGEVDWEGQDGEWVARARGR